MQCAIRKIAAIIVLILVPSLLLTAQTPEFKDKAFTVKLTAPLSTKTSRKGEEVTAQVDSPADYKGWFMVGQIDNAVQPRHD